MRCSPLMDSPSVKSALSVSTNFNGNCPETIPSISNSVFSFFPTPNVPSCFFCPTRFGLETVKSCFHDRLKRSSYEVSISAGRLMSNCITQVEVHNAEKTFLVNGGFMKLAKKEFHCIPPSLIDPVYCTLFSFLPGPTYDAFESNLVFSHA